MRIDLQHPGNRDKIRGPYDAPARRALRHITHSQTVKRFLAPGAALRLWPRTLAEDSGKWA
jgi:hypothetical protein